jgi:hypothetical protein
MRAARWTLTLAGATALGLFGILLSTSGPSGRGDSSHPDRGVLGPVLDPPPRRREVAVIPPERGGVLDIASHEEKLAVLTTGGWTLVIPGGMVTWRGSRTPGAPGWIKRLSAIAVDSTALYVLDEGRSNISVRDFSGRPVQEISIPFGSTYAQRPTQMLLGPDGRPTVTLQRVEAKGEAFWDLLSFDAHGRTVRTLSIEGGSRSTVFNQPLLARAHSTLLSLSPLTHALSSIDPATGRLEPLAARADPPLWYIPRRHRRRYRRMLQGLGAMAARLAALPEFWPSVRDFTVRGDGSLLVAITAGETRQHIELLTGAVEPVGRFNRDGFVDPVFLSGGRAFVAVEGPEETRIYELVPGRG